MLYSVRMKFLSPKLYEMNNNIVMLYWTRMKFLSPKLYSRSLFFMICEIPIFELVGSY